MRSYGERFPIFQSHIDLAHGHWARIVHPGAVVVDATCGNGHDSLALAQLALTDEQGHLYGFDIQSAAIANTHKRLQENLSQARLERISLHCRSHSHLAEVLPKDCRPALIVYNLGYLPGGDKSHTTMLESTMESIVQAQMLVAEDGMVSITCYPGHPEGLREESALLELVSALCPQVWNCCHHRFVNRQRAPSLLLLQKGGYGWC
jgi:hypothetical protein